MRLIAFGIDDSSDFIVQFSGFVQLYSQSPVIIYQIEVVPVPIIDQNILAYSHTEIQISKL